LLLAIMALDRTVSFDGKMPPIVVSSAASIPARQVPTPHSSSIANPAKGLDRRVRRLRSFQHLQLEKEIIMWTLFTAVVFVAGYATSIYSWSRIKLWVNGTQTEIANLEAKAAALKAAL
jgi:uncharacterized membrane protein (UPF0182 family)